MFKKVLIANRGEIALRIICACKELGVPTVAVYSQADKEALHVRMADEAICIGPAPNTESYLNIPSIISAAEVANVDAIHPGYGFLAENAHFAEICEACRITFIGPPAGIINLMGDKVLARERMQACGLPVIPGTAKLENGKDYVKIAKTIGFPVIIKAAAGGGGKGMRIVRAEAELMKSVELAQNEAKTAFGSADVYIEKYIENPRHIEFQVIADNYGHVTHLGERECTIQRRHQKLLEESPSVILDEARRREIGEVVTDVMRTIGYQNVGTMEFLFDEYGHYYFIEMNTRIQVEHPVTEMVTGIDVAKEQIRIAAGEPLSFSQAEVQMRGHSIECRINAECPDTFTPSPGRITLFIPPTGPGTRTDTAVYSSLTIPPYYDSLIAKIISYGRTREGAIRKLIRALEMTVVEGVKTTIPLHLKILSDPDFVQGKLTTSFLERFSKETLLK